MEPGKPYHIYTHSNGTENLFLEKENYRYFLQLYRKYIPAIADTLVYCLMPNHLHFLVQIKTEEELLKVFEDKIKKTSPLDLENQDNNKKPIRTGFENQNAIKDPNLTGFDNLSGLVVLRFSHLLNAYTKAFNKKYQRRGSLFIRSFRRKEVNDESYLIQLVQYIHANPVHHGFVPSMSDWEWSSYNDIIGNKIGLIDSGKLFNWFGGKQNLIEFHQQPISVKSPQSFEME